MQTVVERMLDTVIATNLETIFQAISFTSSRINKAACGTIKVDDIVPQLVPNSFTNQTNESVSRQTTVQHQPPMQIKTEFESSETQIEVPQPAQSVPKVMQSTSAVPTVPKQKIQILSNQVKVEIKTEDNTGIKRKFEDNDDHSIQPPQKAIKVEPNTEEGFSKGGRVITVSLKCPVDSCGEFHKDIQALDKHLLDTHRIKQKRCIVRLCGASFSTR